MATTERAAFGGGRRKPYTAAGIRRLPCSRAGCTRQAHAQWSACADGNLQRPLCAECDVDLNRQALCWWGDPDWKRKIVAYANRVQDDAGRPLDLPWLERDE